jgi:hypothetical protein
MPGGALSVKLFINAGFGEPLNPELAFRLQPLCHGIRTGLAVNDSTPWSRRSSGHAHYFDEAIFV